MEHELMVIRTETLAIQAVVTNVLFELRLLDPTLADAIARGFDNAAAQIEDRAIQAATAVSSETLVRALGITKDLRTASLARRKGRRTTSFRSDCGHSGRFRAAILAGMPQLVLSDAPLLSRPARAGGWISSGTQRSGPNKQRAASAVALAGRSSREGSASRRYRHAPSMVPR
jgi:hypothetical protein